MTSRTSNYRPVSMLPDRQPPWKQFIFSIGSQSIAVVLLLWVAMLHPNVLVPSSTYRAIRLVNTPPPIDHDPTPPQAVKTRFTVQSKLVSAQLKVPQIFAPAPHVEPETPRIEIKTELPLQTAVVIPKQAVKTNVFSSGSSQRPTLAKSRQLVQPGGFGDPRGVRRHDDPNRQVTIAERGAFDLPPGVGHGNGNRGQRGTAGVLANAGFGDGTAIRGRVAPSNADIREGGFGDVTPINPHQNAANDPEAGSHVKAAEIISKPTPAYTDEARKLHIEGEVLLEVVFEGSGAIRVVRVVRGLGHGLDEAAIKAAQEIRFVPAQKDGQPVDFTGVLHVVFQLA